MDARVVIGALIIKHKLKLDDRGTIELIQENPYMQYFLGFMEFRFEPVFHPSLFVTIPEASGLGAEAFDEMTDELLKKAEGAEKEDKQQDNNTPPAAPPGEAEPVDDRQEGEQDSDQDGHHGILKLDATVCDQYIKQDILGYWPPVHPAV